MIDPSPTAMMRISITILGVLFIVSSCKKDDGESAPPPHTNTFSALVNGATHVPKKDGTTVSILGSSVPGTRGILVSATGLNGRDVTVIIYHYDGTVRVYNENESGGCYSSPTAYFGASCTPDSGKTSEVKIISVDKNKYKTGEVATGTFYFDTDSTDEYYHVTNGNFSVFIPDH